nr:hypothetical protein [Tanacetum cinerariifolium]
MINIVVPLQDKSKMFFVGYLAHEFLTEGTISENLYDPAQAKFPPTPLVCHDSADKGNGKCVDPVQMLSLEPRNGNVNRGKEKVFELSSKPKLSEINPQLVMKERYVEVSRELKNGRYMSSIVNPCQLVYFLDLHPEYK